MKLPSIRFVGDELVLDFSEQPTREVYVEVLAQTFEVLPVLNRLTGRELQVRVRTPLPVERVAAAS